jgi:DNA end-binding protein Ku
MARSLWSGSISFGLVNVPVQLVSAARDLDLHFHQLHAEDRRRLEQRRFCKEEDEEVGWEEVGRGYDLDGKQVVLTDEELGAAEPRKTRTIDISSFAPLATIDPIYFDHPYFLIPAGESEGTLRAYRLLVEVMDREGKAAIGRFVMRTKEYLAAIRVRDGALALTTMRFHDEVRPSKQIAPGGRKPARKAIENAVAIIEELTTDWDPTSYADCYRKRLERVVAKKRKGGKIEAPAREKEPEPADDLVAALERTLESVKKGGGAGDARAAAGSEADLESLSREALYERAQEEGVAGRSKMGKKELVEALTR